MSEFHIREAEAADIPVVAANHRKMFAEIFKRKGTPAEDAVLMKLEQAMCNKLEAELSAGSCKAWVVTNPDNETVASGSVSFVSFTPNPDDLSPTVAYIHSMYTEENSRGKRFAGLIIDRILTNCRKRNVKRVMLNASDAGRPVYEKIGFEPVPNMMRYFIG